MVAIISWSQIAFAKHIDLVKLKVSLYIPCYNVEAYLARCIEGVLNQSLPPDEILVIDDGSRDRTLEIAARYPVRVIRHEKNRGLAAARNTGFHNAKNEFVASLDADCVPERNWLKLLARHMESGNVAGVGGKLVEAVRDSLADRWRAVHMVQHWGDQPLSNPHFVFGNNSLFRRSAVEEAGGYDERLWTNGEDSSLSFKLRAKGHDLFYEPSAIVRHLRQDSIHSVLEAYWRYRMDYHNPMTWPKVWRNFRFQHFGSARYELKQDLKNKNFNLLGVDLLMFLYLPYFDFRSAWRGVSYASADPQPEGALRR